MLKIKKSLFICFTTITLNSFSQSVTKNKEAIIVYNTAISKSEYLITIQDTLLIRNSFVLEPIKVDFDKVETKINDRTPKIISSGQKLQWYYLTDVSKMTGMGFNVETQPTRDNIKIFTSNSKNLGYGFIAEPFFFKDGYRIDDYAKGNDTVIDGHKCFIVKANRKIPVSNKSSQDTLLFTKMIIDPSIKGQNYPFISDIIAKHFGGAIVLAESSYQSGLNFTIKFNYKTGLSPTYDKIFDKYQSLYSSNTILFDQLK